MKLLLANGTLIDGSGSGEKGYVADLLISGDRIEKIGTIAPEEADLVLDVRGKCVAPGFIDAHSHNDWFAARKNNARFFESFVQQGITTQVTGNCGFSPYGYEKDTGFAHLIGSGLFTVGDAEGDFSTLNGFAQACTQLPLNIVPLYGHMSGRIGICGYDSRALSESELKRLDAVMEQALSDGAAGVSLGLMYEPDRYAPFEELKRAAEIVAKHGKLLTVHARACSAASTSYNPPVGGRAHNLRALDEIVQLARETGVRLQFSHLIFVGEKTWKTVDEALSIIEQLNREGLDFGYDSYAMTCGASIITVILPPWYLCLGEEGRKSKLARARLALEIGVTKKLLGFDFSDIVITWIGDGYEELVGKSVSDIAQLWKTSELNAYLKLVDLSRGLGRVLMYKYSTKEMLLKLMSDPRCLFMTDAWMEEYGMQNPACYNCFPQFLAFSRESGKQPLNNVIRQMTGATADRFHIKERGYLKEGYFADITVFDRDEVAPSAEPNGKPKGIEQVFINGKQVLKDGALLELSNDGHFLLERI